jgi:hypothetical protein
MPLLARHGECAKGLPGSATHLAPSPGRSGGGRAELLLQKVARVLFGPTGSVACLYVDQPAPRTPLQAPSGLGSRGPVLLGPGRWGKLSKLWAVMDIYLHKST